jgi:hypothetical protein
VIREIQQFLETSRIVAYSVVIHDVIPEVLKVLGKICSVGVHYLTEEYLCAYCK